MSGRFSMTAPRCFSGRADTYHCSPGRRSYSSSGSLYTRYTPSYGPSYGNGPSYGYGPYEGATADPYGGYLRGAADIIGAQGRMLVTQQQSMLTAERVSQARLETRRREFDEWLY